MQGYPPPGYPQPGYPGYPPPQPSSNKTLIIVLVVVGVILLLGGGSCVVCVGLASIANKPDPTPDHTEIAKDLERSMREQKIPVGQVLCPKNPGSDRFECELTATTGDSARVSVTKDGANLAWVVQNTAFLSGEKLVGIFVSINPANARLRVACFTGTLMKGVDSTFTCPVLDGASPAGDVTVHVLDKDGKVDMKYQNPYATPSTPTLTTTPPSTPKPAKGPRVIDFVCPAGKAPGGAVRSGCLCGSDILGTACGAPGNFTDVQATARGCRFTCAN